MMQNFYILPQINDDMDGGVCVANNNSNIMNPNPPVNYLWYPSQLPPPAQTHQQSLNNGNSMDFNHVPPPPSQPIYEPNGIPVAINGQNDLNYYPRFALPPPQQQFPINDCYYDGPQQLMLNCNAIESQVPMSMLPQMPITTVPPPSSSTSSSSGSLINNNLNTMGQNFPRQPLPPPPMNMLDAPPQIPLPSPQHATFRQSSPMIVTQEYYHHSQQQQQQQHLNQFKTWIGELPETQNNITHYQCRFLIEKQMFDLLKIDLIKLFDGRVQNISLDEPITTASSSLIFLYAYFNRQDFSSFLKCCRPSEDGSITRQFVHPNKKYSIFVFVKAFNQKNDHQFTVQNLYKSPVKRIIYVHGLASLFIAKDLFIIYNDLYGNVSSVKIFPERSSFLGRSAVICFCNHDSYFKALKDYPNVIIKTPFINCTLQNRYYNRRNRFSFRSNNKFENGHPINKMNGNSNHVFFNEQNDWNILKIRQDAFENDFQPYLNMKNKYNMFRRLKHRNYLSD